MADNKFVIGLTDDIKKHYKFLTRIGQPGQFGYAMRAMHLESKEERAVKVISKGRFVRAADKAFQMAQLRAEISVMKKLDHPNIIKFYEVFENEEELCIVMELCTGGELFDRIKEAGSYSEKDASAVLRQMVAGLQYLHANNIAHCDLKPDNFLFQSKSPDSLIKIIDFGMSKFVKRGKYFKSLCGTPYYVAPEVIQGHYNQHSDMWSLGVVLFVMLFGYPPFYADEEVYGKDTDNKIFELVQHGFEPVTKEGYGPHFPTDIPCSESAKDLLANLLTLDIAKRLTATEALEHPWLKGETATETPISASVIKDLKSFTGACKLKAAILSVMAEQLNETEVEELKKTFRAIDVNGDGNITFEELQNALAKMGEVADLKVIEQMFKSADIDGNGVLSYEEMVMASVQRKLLAKEERLFNTFRSLDLDGDGRVTVEEIEKVLGKDNETAKRLIAEADVDHDGTIDYDEFVNMWGSQQAA